MPVPTRCGSDCPARQDNRAGGYRVAPLADRLGEPLDQSRIELLRSLDDGEGAVLGEIIDQYLAQTARGRDELVRAVGEGDIDAVEHAAHTHRGASANVGARALAGVCAEMEVHARGGQIDRAAGLLGRFDEEFARVHHALGLITSTG
jgi:HPt (histidine-containing phosphotransfer) domain-containing protein